MVSRSLWNVIIKTSKCKIINFRKCKLVVWLHEEKYHISPLVHCDTVEAKDTCMWWIQIKLHELPGKRERRNVLRVRMRSEVWNLLHFHLVFLFFDSQGVCLSCWVSCKVLGPYSLPDAVSWELNPGTMALSIQKVNHRLSPLLKPTPSSQKILKKKKMILL